MTETEESHDTAAAATATTEGGSVKGNKEERTVVRIGPWQVELSLRVNHEDGEPNSCLQIVATEELSQTRFSTSFVPSNAAASSSSSSSPSITRKAANENNAHLPTGASSLPRSLSSGSSSSSSSSTQPQVTRSISIQDFISLKSSAASSFSLSSSPSSSSSSLTASAGSLPTPSCSPSDFLNREDYERELILAKDRAEEAAKAKSIFLANMSHEIRTPLCGIITMTSLLADEALTPSQKDLVRTIRASGGILLGIVNDILDFSKLEATQVVLKDLHFDLEKCVESVCDVLVLQAQKKDLELVCYVDPDIPRSVRGDPGRLAQVLLNLVNNAIKFTSKGEVRVEIYIDGSPFYTEDKKRKGRYQMRVVDTGIGIHPDSIEKLFQFQPFTQIDNSTSRKYEGTGLGLVICNRIVQLMNGTIDITSVVGEGSTFTATVELELNADASDSNAPSRRNSLMPRRISTSAPSLSSSSSSLSASSSSSLGDPSDENNKQKEKDKAEPSVAEEELEESELNQKLMSLLQIHANQVPPLNISSAAPADSEIIKKKLIIAIPHCSVRNVMVKYITAKLTTEGVLNYWDIIQCSSRVELQHILRNLSPHDFLPRTNVSAKLQEAGKSFYLGKIHANSHPTTPRVARQRLMARRGGLNSSSSKGQPDSNDIFSEAAEEERVRRASSYDIGYPERQLKDGAPSSGKPRLLRKSSVSMLVTAEAAALYDQGSHNNKAPYTLQQKRYSTSSESNDDTTWDTDDTEQEDYSENEPQEQDEDGFGQEQSNNNNNVGQQQAETEEDSSADNNLFSAQNPLGAVIVDLSLLLELKEVKTTRRRGGTVRRPSVCPELQSFCFSTYRPLLVLVSSMIGKSRAKECVDTGLVDRMITTPVKRRCLLRALSSLFPQDRSFASPSSSPSLLLDKQREERIMQKRLSRRSSSGSAWHTRDFDLKEYLRSNQKHLQKFPQLMMESISSNNKTNRIRNNQQSNRTASYTSLRTSSAGGLSPRDKLSKINSLRDIADDEAMNEIISLKDLGLPISNHDSSDSDDDDGDSNNSNSSTNYNNNNKQANSEPRRESQQTVARNGSVVKKMVNFSGEINQIEERGGKREGGATGNGGGGGRGEQNRKAATPGHLPSLNNCRQEDENSRSQETLRILVVEDNRINQKVLLRVIDRYHTFSLVLCFPASLLLFYILSSFFHLLIVVSLATVIFLVANIMWHKTDKKRWRK
ncbi:ATPase/histidine kinase/DNA gyrase B/HSP90 domain containing protein, variant 2 [Balamuthia mandrillaris]